MTGWLHRYCQSLGPTRQLVGGTGKGRSVERAPEGIENMGGTMYWATEGKTSTAFTTLPSQHPFCAYLPVIFCWLVMVAMLLMLPVRLFCLQHILYRYLYTTALAHATPLNSARPEPVHPEGFALGQKRERMVAWL